MPQPRVLRLRNKEVIKISEKKFNLKVYGIFAIVIVAIVITVLTVFAFMTGYTGFDEEKVAVAYVDTIVQSGDGYNAYKNTTLSKDLKFGDFIRQQYLYPVIYDGYEAGGSTKDLTGLDDEAKMGEKSLNDDGTLEGELIDAMYPVFLSLVEANNGFDNYDVIFTEYVSALKIQRKAVFGDDYFDDSIFFTCFEANVDTYSKSLTGTEETVDSNTGAITQEKSTGAYQVKYGEDYRLETVSEGVTNQGDNEAVVTLKVLANGETVVDGIEIHLVKYGKTWYVESDKCDTSVLYSFYK